MGEIEGLSIVQLKRYLDAISKKEVRDCVLRAKLYRISMADKRNFDNFVNSLENREISSKPPSEKDMRDMGFSKKG